MEQQLRQLVIMGPKMEPVKTVREDGTQVWLLDGKRHRDDGPAWIGADGTQAWYQHGKLHRDEAAAVIWLNGSQEWYQHGKLHRGEAAAVIWSSGRQAWYQHGKLHRDDGPAWIGADGTKEHWLNDTQLTEGSLALVLIKQKEKRKGVQDGTAS